MDAVTIVSIETTQAIQTFSRRRVRLVAYRPTVVRLMARHNLGPGVVPIARARMRVIPASGAPSPWFDPVNGTSPPAANPWELQLKESPDRSVTDDSFNFRVPAALCVGTLSWEFDLRVHQKYLPQGSSEFRLTQQSRVVRFQPRKTLEIRYIRVHWAIPSPSGSGTVNSLPTDDQCMTAIMDGCQLHPTAHPLVSSAFGTIMVADAQHASPVWDVLERLRLFRDALDPSTWTIRDPTWEGIWCAIFDNPGSRVLGETMSVEANFAAHAARIPIAHELGHCLNQEHLGTTVCPLLGLAANAEDPSTFLGGGRITDVPFDVVENRVVAPDPVFGPAYWDFMTYCQGALWVSVERWRRLWFKVGPP